MTTLFEELFKPESRAYPKEMTWIKSSDDVYTAELELAGFAKKDVKLTATNELLTVQAEKGEKKKNYSISLNDLVSLENISSKMSNGLLTITMPKKQVKESFAIKID
jgi:HSP20 family molecular chaperone IbpA